MLGAGDAPVLLTRDEASRKSPEPLHDKDPCPQNSQGSSWLELLRLRAETKTAIGRACEAHVPWFFSVILLGQSAYYIILFYTILYYTVLYLAKTALGRAAQSQATLVAFTPDMGAQRALGKEPGVLLAPLRPCCVPNLLRLLLLRCAFTTAS